MGVTGIKLAAVRDLAPEQLSQTGRRELRHLLRAHNLELVALDCPLRHGLDVAEDLEPRLDHIKQVMSLSYDLGPRIVTIEAGQIPEGDSAEEQTRLRLLSEALADLGAHGDRVGSTLALETGLESGATLNRFLDRFDTGSLGISFDPANLLMNGFQPLEDLQALHRRIVQVQAKDARRHTASRSAMEVPLGHGELDWMALLTALDEVGFSGWVVVQRDNATSLPDISQGVALLRRLGG